MSSHVPLPLTKREQVRSLLLQAQLEWLHCDGLLRCEMAALGFSAPTVEVAVRQHPLWVQTAENFRKLHLAWESMF